MISQFQNGFTFVNRTKNELTGTISANYLTKMGFVNKNMRKLSEFLEFFQKKLKGSYLGYNEPIKPGAKLI